MLQRRLSGIRGDGGYTLTSNLIGIAVGLAVASMAITAILALNVIMSKGIVSAQSAAQIRQIEAQWQNDAHGAERVDATDATDVTFVGHSLDGSCRISRWQLTGGSSSQTLTNIVRTSPSSSGSGSTYACTGAVTAPGSRTAIKGLGDKATFTYRTPADRDVTYTAGQPTLGTTQLQPARYSASDWAATNIRFVTVVLDVPTPLWGEQVAKITAHTNASLPGYDSSNANQEAPFPFAIAKPAPPTATPNPPAVGAAYTVNWSATCPTQTTFYAYEVGQNDYEFYSGNARSKATTASTDGTSAIYRVQILCLYQGTIGASEFSDPLTVTPTITAPTGVAVTVAINGSGAGTATAGVATCVAPATPQYRFQYQVSAQAASAWSSWGSDRVLTGPTIPQGGRWLVTLNVRCVIGSATSDTGIATGTAVRAVTAPTGVSTTITFIDPDTARATVTATCPTGTDKTYDIKLQVNTNTASWRGETGTAYTQKGTFYQGYKATADAKVRCVGDYAQSTQTSAPQETAIRSVDTPKAPTGGRTNALGGADYDDDRMIWNRADCPTGTDEDYRLRRLRDDTGYSSTGLSTGGWGSAKLAGSEVYFEQVSNKPGVRYQYQIDARCIGVNDTSNAGPWSPDVDWRTEFPVATPAAPGASDTSPASGNAVTISWYGACPSGSSRVKYDVNNNGGTFYDGTGGSKSDSRSSAGTETYTVRVLCESADGTQKWSSTSGSRSVTWYNPPAAPKGFSTSGKVFRSCTNDGWKGTVDWSDVAGATSYDVQVYWTDANGVKRPWKSEGSTSGTTKSMTETGSTGSNVGATVRVRAVGPGGAGAWSAEYQLIQSAGCF